MNHWIGLTPKELANLVDKHYDKLVEIEGLTGIAVGVSNKDYRRCLIKLVVSNVGDVMPAGLAAHEILGTTQITVKK